jgi:hypothetical protein
MVVGVGLLRRSKRKQQWKKKEALTKERKNGNQKQYDLRRLTSRRRDVHLTILRTINRKSFWHHSRTKIE